jgi:hypothetical protein
MGQGGGISVRLFDSSVVDPSDQDGASEVPLSTLVLITIVVPLFKSNAAPLPSPKMLNSASVQALPRSGK